MISPRLCNRWPLPRITRLTPYLPSVLIPLALLLLTLPTALGATVRGLVERQGRSSRDPATYIKVTLTAAASKSQRYTVYTDGKGMYYFQDVPPGTYNLEIWVPSSTRRAAAYQVRVNPSSPVQQAQPYVDLEPVLMFEPALLELAWGMFSAKYAARQSAYNHLMKNRLNDPTTIPALIVVAKENIAKLDGIANVLTVIRSVQLPHFMANRRGVEEFIDTVNANPRAKKATNIQKQIRLIRARYQQQQQIQQARPAARS